MVLGVALGLVSACGSDTTPFTANPVAGDAGAGPTSGAGAPDDPEAASGAGGATAEPPANDAALFDAEHVVEVELTLAPSDWDSLRRQSRGLDTLLGEDCQAQPFASPFGYVHADVTVDGVALTNVGLRKKGFLGSLDDNKPSLKLDLDEYVDQELNGTRDLTLNNAKQDPSYLRQCIGYATFAAAGVPASRCNFAHVTVNGQDLGLYVHVEAIKKPMLRRHFKSDEGNLYEGTLSDFRVGWLGTFDKKTNESDPTRPELDAVTAAAAEPDSALMASLDASLDVEEFTTLWAVEVLLEHWDGYAGNQNNFYVYGDPISGKTAILPWGIDQLFGGSGSEPQPEKLMTTGVLAHRLFAHPEGRARFEARLRQLLDTTWHPEELVAEVDRMARLVAPFVKSAERLQQALAVAELKSRIRARRTELLAALAAAPLELAPMRGQLCFREIGSVAGTFSTTWGTAGTPDPFSAGTATLDAVIDGGPWMLQPNSIGSVAGPSDEPAGEFPVGVSVPALRTDGMLAILYFGLKAEQVKPGDVVLDIATAPSLLFELDPNVKDAAPTLLGTIFGTLHFDQAASVPGAVVSGSYAGKVYASGLLGTQ